MQKDMMETMQKMTQAALDNLKQLSDTNMRVGEKLMQEQVDLATSVFDMTNKTVETMTEAKSYKDLASEQAKMAQELSKTVMESAHTNSEILTDAGKVYTKMFETGMKEASNTVTKATSKTRKSA